VVGSGAGGNGCVAFRREPYVPRGGPSGGDGGAGGDLILRATTSKNTLVDIRFNRRYIAERGENGGTAQRSGACGADLILDVPVGTMIYDAEDDLLLADLAKEGETWHIDGANGGHGNIHFKSANHRTPRFATDGAPGTERKVRLELKLIADVGLLGFPNAGKSTLISCISAARPRVAAHPFTTITPNLGVVEVEAGVSFVVADIPGLIEGASDGKGLGHQFLKHVERCPFFLHLLEPEELDTTPVERLKILNKELGRYNEDLMKRPQLVVLTKKDLLTDEKIAELTEEIKRETGASVTTISAVTGQGIRELVFNTHRALTQLRGRT
jgi:GTP-binding protein